MSPSRAARLAVGLVLFAPAALGAETAFLFDVLQKPAYRSGWERLMKEVQPTPDWLMQFNKNLDGAAGEVMTRTIDGKDYELSFVCKPQDCAAHKFAVLFDGSSKKAYGALGGADAPPAFYGAPPPALQDALAKAFEAKS